MTDLSIYSYVKLHADILLTVTIPRTEARKSRNPLSLSRVLKFLNAAHAIRAPHFPDLLGAKNEDRLKTRMTRYQGSANLPGVLTLGPALVLGHNFSTKTFWKVPKKNKGMCWSKTARRSSFDGGRSLKHSLTPGVRDAIQQLIPYNLTGPQTAGGQAGGEGIGDYRPASISNAFRLRFACAVFIKTKPFTDSDCSSSVRTIHEVIFIAPRARAWLREGAYRRCAPSRYKIGRASCRERVCMLV